VTLFEEALFLATFFKLMLFSFSNARMAMLLWQHPLCRFAALPLTAG
jgi:hypothetical protein